MNRITDALESLFLGAMNFFEGMARRRGDDPLLAEYKTRKWGGVWGICAVLAVFLFSLAAASILNAVESISGPLAILDSATEYARSACMVAFALAVAFTAWTVWSLFAFRREIGLE